MNERLKNLKEEALVWAVETLDPDELNEYEWGVAIDQKFAELIVKECMSLMNQEKDRCDNPGSYESDVYYTRMVAQAAAYENAADIIRYHFEVNE